MDFNPYAQIKTLVVGLDGSASEEITSAPAGYAPNFSMQQAHDNRWRDVRHDRDGRLAACDWVVAASVERGVAVPAEWAAYRQSLRNITAQLNPFLIDWPEPPIKSAGSRQIYSTLRPGA